MTEALIADTTAFKIEQSGINLIRREHRHGSARDLFWLWTGTNINVFFVVTGAVVASLGLTFGQAMIAIVVGNITYLAVGVTSLQGPTTGTTTFTISRAAFGPNGGRLLAFFNWVTCVGFEASGIALIGLAELALLDKAGVSSSGDGVKILCLAVAGVAQVLLPIFGHATIMKMLKWVSYLFAPMFLIVAIFVMPKLHVTAGKPATWSMVTVAIALVAVSGGLSWANFGSDYSRYLPEDVSPKGVFWWTSIGGFIPSVLLNVLGAAVGYTVSTGSDPISGLPSILPGGVVVPYLFLIIASLLTVNTIDLYSSGLSLQTVGVRLRRWQCVLVDLAICLPLAAFTIFSSRFNRLYSDFLSLLILWLSPWFAIYVSDWLLRRRRYETASLMSTSGGLYWGRAGIRYQAIVAQIVGMTASALWINSPAFVGPLSSRTGSSDFSIEMGIGFGLATYLLLSAITRPKAHDLTSAGPVEREPLVAASGTDSLSYHQSLAPSPEPT